MDPSLKIFWRKCSDFVCSRQFLFVLIGIGLLLRLKYYSENLSLWLDEAALALEILRRSFSEIFFVANYNQYSPTAPVGFLLLEKSVIVFLGSSEWALRLVPLMCSVLSVFLFLPLARKYVRAEAVPAALASFALAGPLIYYSAQVKSYSCDVLVAIFVLWGAAHVRDAQLGPRQAIVIGVIAAVVLWFSYSALFVVGGALVVLITFAFIEKRREKGIFLFGVACLAGISFLAGYFNEITQIRANSGLYGMWQKAFLPWSAGPAASVIWLKDATGNIFKDALGQPLAYLAAGLFFVGTATVFARDKERCFLLVSPAAIVLLAAAAHKYPFFGRFVLFLVPSLALLMAEGIVYVIDKFFKRPAVAILLSAVVFFYPVQNAADVLSRTHAFEEMKPVMRYLKGHYQERDAIFLNNSAQYGYGYYSGRWGLDTKELFVGVIVEPPNPFRSFDPAVRAVYVNYERGALGHLVGWHVGQSANAFSKEEWEKVRDNKRTWLIFSHASAGYRKTVLDYFGREGKKLEEFHAPGASIYLFDMEKS